MLALLALVGMGLPIIAVQAGRPEPQLAAVRFVSSDPAVLADIVQAAKSVGWTESKIDRPGTVTIRAPQDYTSGDFGRLLRALETVKSKDFGLQLVDSLGRVIGPDGKPVEE